MAENWVNIKLEGVVPTSIKQLASTIDTIVSALKAALNIQVTALKVISALSTDLLNAEALIIKSAVSTLESALDPLLSDASIHLLVVPFRKQTNYRLADPEYFRTWKFADSDDGPPVDQTAALEERKLNEKLKYINFYEGGNYGFLRTVMEALDDQGDDQRPQYDENHAIFANVWVAGASDIVGILDALLTLEGLFGISLKSNSFVPRNLIRTPQDVTAKQIVAPAGKKGVLLGWGNPPAETTFPEFGDVRLRLYEVAVVRSTDDNVMTARSWTDIFGGEQPKVMDEDETEDETDGLESENEKSQVIARFRYDGVRDSYLDDWSDFKENTDYYYTVAFRYGVEMPPGVSVSNATIVDGFSIMDYKLISAVQHVRFNKNMPESTQGVKPDWVATPGILSLIPDLQFYIAALQQYINALSDQALGANSALQSYISFLEAEIQRYEDLAEQITARIQKLVGLLKTPEAGIYTTAIALEEGGTAAFMRELMRRMLDEGDTSAPPFRSGTEFVAGIVMLAGAPNFAQLSSIKTLVDLLFGTSTSLKTAFEEAVDSIEKVIEEQSEQILGPDLQPTTTTPTETTAYKTFDDGMNPVSENDPDANVPFDP